MSAYIAAGHRIQTAIAILMGRDPNWGPVQPKHMRTGIDMSKSDQAGLVTLLIAKGVFTKDEYIAAVTQSATDEANAYETSVQAVLGHRGVRTG